MIMFIENNLITLLLFLDELHAILPNWVSHLFIQCVAGSFGGFTTTIITNPLDIVRARLQVCIFLNYCISIPSFELWIFLLIYFRFND